MEVVFAKKMVIGKLKEAGKITLELELRKVRGLKETVEHTTVKDYTELSICGEILTKNGRGWYSGGQIDSTLQEALEAVGGYRELNITRKQLKEILSIWKEWHLNGLKAGCIHQESFNVNEGDFYEKQAIETAKCPHGYKYGSKWLVKELPESVENRIKELFSLND